MNTNFATPFGGMDVPDASRGGQSRRREETTDSRNSVPAAIVYQLIIISLLAFVSLVWSSHALAAEPSETLVLLVARPAVNDPLYGQSVLIVREMAGGHHVGFIINKPTILRLTEAFPDHEPSKTVADPLYLGGPSNMNVVFALVHGRMTAADGVVALTGNLYLAVSDIAVDKAMTPAGQERARFFAGAVIWRAGELEAEIKQGAWFVLDATPELVLPEKTAGLWQQLVQRADIVANGI